VQKYGWNIRTSIFALFVEFEVHKHGRHKTYVRKILKRFTMHQCSSPQAGSKLQEML